MVKRSLFIALAALSCVMLLATGALATTHLAGVGSAISSGTTDAKSVIGDNMPLVFGVAVAFVAWKVGKRVLGRI